jgi:hypothetical protein
MQATTKVYRTVREARSALALDAGFDPFSIRRERCTKAKLAAAGYTVDQKEWKRRQRERKEWELRGRCRECGEPAETQMFCSAHGVCNCCLCHEKRTGLCRAHTRYSYVCDNGHRLVGTEEEAAAKGHKCPKCGEYWV